MQKAEAANVLEVEGLTRSFNSKPALSDVSFSVGRGQIFGFLGPNGAGKTTTIRLLLGLLRPDGGTIRLFGEKVGVKSREIYRRVGFMLHDPGLYDELSCYDNLLYYADLYDVGKGRIEELLRDLGLWDKKGEPAGKFSRGMKQKVVLARALLHDPDFLILDEPATGLDPEMQVWMRQYLKGLAEAGKTIFFSDHNLHEVQQVCSHIGILYNGRLLGCGSVDAMTGSKALSVEDVYLKLVKEARQ